MTKINRKNVESKKKKNKDTVYHKTLTLIWMAKYPLIY